MRRRSLHVPAIVFGILLAATAAAVVAYKIAYPSYAHRMRLTIEVSVDGRVRTGSGVIEITWHRQPPGLGEVPPWRCSIKGDAVLVDLENGHHLFALLRQVGDDRGHHRDDVCATALRSYGFRGSPSQEALGALSRMRGRAAVADRAVPTFITFTDSSDPASAVIVQPREFQSLLGGAQLASMWVELTDQRVTRGIVERVPAVGQIIKRYTGRKSERPGVFRLWGTDFTQPLEAQTPDIRTPPRRRVSE